MKTVKIYPFRPKKLKQYSFLSSINYYIRSSIREARRRKLYFLLALLSTAMVVAATAVTQTIISYTPLIFLKISESYTGSLDVSIQPISMSVQQNDGFNVNTMVKNLLLNTTSIRQQINLTDVDNMASRYLFGASGIVTPSGKPNCSGLTSPPYVNCSVYPVPFVVQETQQENTIGITDYGQYPFKISANGLVINRKVAQALSLHVGDSVTVQADVTELLKEVILPFNAKQSNRSSRIDDQLFQPSIAYISYQIEAIVDNFFGKLSSDFSVCLIGEYKNFFQVLAQSIISTPASSHKSFSNFTNFLQSDDPQNYANWIIFNLPNRQKVYMNSNFDKIQSDVTNFGSRVYDILGVQLLDMDLPILQGLTHLKFIGMFLGIVLNIIVVVLFILSTVLIYNLLMVTVETKTFEFGTIRLLGLTKIGVAQLIFIQALSFVIPGVILGLGSSIPLLMYAGGKLENALQTKVSTMPTGSALAVSLIVGILIPLISSYYPMKKALGKDLNLSLDTAHSKTSSIQISIEIGSRRMPWARITFGFLITIFGIGIYILLPLSLLTSNLGLLLTMFFVILLGLLFGLSLLSLNFQHIAEKIFARIFFFWTSSSFRSLILKNLVAHKLRNRQTAIMYSLSLGFVLFINVFLSLELNNLAYVSEAEKGALIELSTSSQTRPLNATLLEQTINANLTSVIESYAYITQDLATFAKNHNYTDVFLTNRGRIYNVYPSIRGVSPSIFKTAIDKFLISDDIDQSSLLDLGDQLYTARGSQGVIIGQTYKRDLDLSLDIDSSVLLIMENGTSSKIEELRVLATLESAPGFNFSKLPSVVSQDILISLPTFRRLASNITSSATKIPFERMLIKVKDDSFDNIDIVTEQFGQLRQNRYPSLKVWDFRDTAKTLQTNQSTLSFIFMAVEVLSMALSMFSLITSMSTNILEQVKEIGVLRVVGLTRLKVNLLYVCEAFILVFTSAIFGVIIGTAVACILAIQTVLFTGLPLMFSFPFKDLGLIFGVAIASAFASSYLPAYNVTRLQISKINRLGL